MNDDTSLLLASHWPAAPPRNGGIPDVPRCASLTVATCVARLAETSDFTIICEEAAPTKVVSCPSQRAGAGQAGHVELLPPVLARSANGVLDAPTVA